MTIAEKEKTILGYMSSLQISRAEAEQLFEDDNSDEVLPEVAEMETKAKELKRHYEKGEPKKKKSNTPKERKVDEEKKVMINALKECLESQLGYQVTKVTTETEIDFIANGQDFTLKLTRHKKKK